MFKATHLLVSRSQSTPVQLVKSTEGFFLVTEIEWQRQSKPVFEIRQGDRFFCNGLPILRYSLQPLDSETSQNKSTSTVPSS